MLAKVYSCAVVGLDGVLVEVEVDVGTGQPGMVVVGLPDAAVQESKERVRAAIRNSGGKFPHGRVTINLAPADLKKAGPTYDLPIALGILVASGQVPPGFEDALIVGELSLDGVLRHTPGIISMVSLAKDKGMARALVPHDDAPEAALVGGVEVFPVRTLADLVNHLTGEARIEATRPGAVPEAAATIGGTDFSDIRGQEHVKRGLEVAAAGGHATTDDQYSRPRRQETEPRRQADQPGRPCEPQRPQKGQQDDHHIEPVGAQVAKAVGSDGELRQQVRGEDTPHECVDGLEDSVSPGRELEEQRKEDEWDQRHGERGQRRVGPPLQADQPFAAALSVPYQGHCQPS
ncbi:MAG: ATP-binding protein [Chloroflexia bacterium]|nr:ATP-binding protein [Chloroflexia bacterium]